MIWEFLYVILGIVSLKIGDIFMNKRVKDSFYANFFKGFMCYLLGMLFFAHNFKVIQTVLLTLFNLIILIAVSWFVSKKTIIVEEIVFIILGVSAIILLECN